MSKTLSQIYSEAVRKRNLYLQITELNSGLTQSKMSILNLITYVQALLIYSYQTVLDVFEVNIASLINSRINGTSTWYAAMALKFQYNSITNSGDTLIFDEDTLKIRYETIDETHRIVAKSAFDDNGANGIILKICKKNSNSAEIANGINYTQLSSNELTAFKGYINQIKFIGAKVQTLSIPGDIITIKNCEITYDDQYITDEQAMQIVRDAMINFASSLDYNAFIYSQTIIDSILSSEYIVNISTGVQITIKEYNTTTRKYDEEKPLTNIQKAYSGYVRFLDENGNSTLKRETGFITLKKMSEV